MRIYLLVIYCLFLQSCKTTYDLVIQNAKVFDTKQGVLLSNKTIFINKDTIVKIIDNNISEKGRKVINAAGKLVTPGIIDTHVHPTDIFGDYAAAPKYLAEDSLPFLRKKFSDNYLPFGITAVMIMGQPEAWLKPILNWSANTAANCTDIYTAGGALISKEERKPYIGHITVESPLAARQKIIKYYDLGIRYIKLYYRLRRPEFEAAFKTADSLGMKIYGHIDGGVMLMDTTLLIGLKNYEHLFTIIHSIPFTTENDKNYKAWVNNIYGKGKSDSLSFIEEFLNEVRWNSENQSLKIDSLINNLAMQHTSFSTTIHLFAEKIGLAYFSNRDNKPDINWSEKIVKHNVENFNIFMLLAKKMYDKGIQIRIGTDCANGGKAALSEQLLLYEYGFSIPEIIKISTINGARALGMENKYGSIEKGKKADLIIYDQSPFDNYKNFLADRTVIKDGKVFNDPPKK